MVRKYASSTLHGRHIVEKMTTDKLEARRDYVQKRLPDPEVITKELGK